ncbi:ABC transporter substrate-binding protein [Boseongicola aestuarii]|uniref:Bacterial extracellular solute-binding protein n=1 Tax=Boseongicola aestuarii TaxID=1470561 RepID=A0A238IZB4_9RHOB|nr:extracellular solute-binding protein [Boseongicola aestuarii]SMX23828.1 Bacterial extracellular solute-binding protein [Boseongicola aestuarii]
MSLQKGRARARPEGPFEGSRTPLPKSISGEEFSRFLDFIEALGNEADQVLSLRSGYDETRLITTLLRNHLKGKMTTTSFLANASGLGYGTAIRAINSIEERGLLIRRPRTQTGKSFSLHPTEKLIGEWQEYARRVRGAIGSTLGLEGAGRGGMSDYFFGSSYGDSGTIPPPTPLQSKLNLQNNLRVLVHADPTFLAMNVLKRQFEALFGTGIDSRALSIDRLRQEILSNATRKSSRYDIIACDLPWFGELAEKKILMPIDGLLSDDKVDLADFHEVALASARHRGEQYGLPVQTTPELLCVRRDLCDTAGIGVPFTISDTLETARKLHSRAQGRSGIAWNAARGTPLGHTFMFVMGAMGRPFLNLEKTDTGYDAEWSEGENLRPALQSDEAVATAEYLRELLDFSPVSILSMSWYERARAYADGEVAMAYCATLLAPLFELNKASPAYGVTDFLPHPYGPGGKPLAPVGGYALAIPSNIAPDRVAAVWDAMRLLTSPESIKLYIENGSLVSPRFSVSMDPDVRRISPLISIVDGMARSGILQFWPRPPVPEITDLITIIGTELHDMLQGSKSVEVALTNAQNRADALMRGRGHY